MEEVSSKMRTAHGSAFHEILKKQVKKGDLNAISNYDNYIKSLLSIHKEFSETLSWEQFIGTPEPKLPERQSLNQDIAEQEYKAYIPTVLDKMLFQCKNKKNELIKNAEQAKRYDDLIYNAALKEFRNEHRNWTKAQLFTKGIRNGDLKAYQHAIQFFNPFQSIVKLGAKLECEFFSEYIIAHMNLHPEEMIPDYIVSQASTGKILKQEMPIFNFNEICHQHVCSCSLRIAREIFTLLPVQSVFVKTYAAPEKPEERYEERVMLTVKFGRAEFLELNLKTGHAADYIAKFPHNIDFSTTGGFSLAKPLIN